VVDTAWVALSLTHRLGGKTFRSLLSYFDNDLHAILHAPAKSLREVPGIGPTIAHAITQIDLKATEQAIQRWQKAGVRILTLTDPKYPVGLAALPDRPPTLFVCGTLLDLSTYIGIAVVGARQPSMESFTLAQDFGSKLAQRGRVVISGLAKGIDAAAHMGALAVPKGNTLAVLGSGVLNNYPPENDSLAEAILVREGALVSEVAPDAPVSAPGLVARNRLITGLSQGVIVVESDINGGAMHAMRFARQQGKPLYAVDNDASGNRALLENGATPISQTGEGLPI
jgi:DNA processing protein